MQRFLDHLQIIPKFIKYYQTPQATYLATSRNPQMPFDIVFQSTDTSNDVFFLPHISTEYRMTVTGLREMRCTLGTVENKI